MTCQDRDSLRNRIEDFIDGDEWQHGLSCASWYDDHACNCWQSGLRAALAGDSSHSETGGGAR